MLELDLVLEPFVEHRYRSLSEEQQRLYRKLLTCEDQELYGWLLGRLRPQDPELAGMVDLVVDFARQPD